MRRRKNRTQAVEEALRAVEHHLDHHINAIILKTRIERMQEHVQKALRLCATSVRPVQPEITDELNQALEAIDAIPDEDTISSGFLQYEVDAPLVDHLAE